MRLRVKDSDFQRSSIVVRAAKGGKDREILFPEVLQEDGKKQLAAIHQLYGQDREADDSIVKYDC